MSKPLLLTLAVDGVTTRVLTEQVCDEVEFVVTYTAVLGVPWPPLLTPMTSIQ
jgi:hypothetical protein